MSNKGFKSWVVSNVPTPPVWIQLILICTHNGLFVKMERSSYQAPTLPLPRGFQDGGTEDFFGRGDSKQKQQWLSSFLILCGLNLKSKKCLCNLKQYLLLYRKQNAYYSRKSINIESSWSKGRQDHSYKLFAQKRFTNTDKPIN